MSKLMLFKVDNDIVDIWSQNNVFDRVELSRNRADGSIVMESIGYDESYSKFCIILHIPKRPDTTIGFIMTSQKSNSIFRLNYDRITGDITTGDNLKFDADVEESIERSNHKNMLKLFDYYTYRITRKFNFNGNFINHILDI